MDDFNRFHERGVKALERAEPICARLGFTLEVVQALAPWARTVHIKDQAVQPCPEGFLLSDAALGDGFLPLPEMVAGRRRARSRGR